MKRLTVPISVGRLQGKKRLPGRNALAYFAHRQRDLVTFARSDICVYEISAKGQVTVPLLGATCQGGFHLPRQAL
jgi:hypothetical protein